MTVRAMSLFFALLALGANAVVLAAAVGQLGRGSAAIARWRSAAVDEVRPYALGLAAFVASVATAGSLYYSEGAGFPPCPLCWVQRGFMYPLALVLIVAAVRGWWRIRRAARAWALVGAAVSVWHLLVERFPALEGSAICDPANPCSIRWVEEFGFITIPYMALSAFLLAAVLLSVAAPEDPSRADDAALETTETR